MNDQTINRPTNFRPSLESDSVRSAVLMTGVQVFVALAAAVLATSSVLA